MCTSNNGGKGVEDAVAVQEVESEVRLSLDEKAPPPKQNSTRAALPNPNHCSEMAGGSFYTQQVEKALRGGWLNTRDIDV